MRQNHVPFIFQLGRIQTLAENRKAKANQNSHGKQYVLLHSDWLLLFYFLLFCHSLDASLDFVVSFYVYPLLSVCQFYLTLASCVKLNSLWS